MGKIQGQTVTLYERTQTGVDTFGDPVYTEAPVVVDNVLIGQPTTDDITSATALYNKRLEYVLGLPKGDAHAWEDCRVDFFGQSFRVFGAVIQGIEANVPGPWHKKVRVEKYA